MIALIYIPVLHEGYRQLLLTQQWDAIWLVDISVIQDEFPYLKKDIRALPVEKVLEILQAWNSAKEVRVLSSKNATADNIKSLVKGGKDLTYVVTNDEIGRWLAKEFLSEKKVEFYTPFLRWDRESATAEQEAMTDKTITLEELGRQFFGVAEKEASKSSDWWRRVGAAVAKDGQLLLSAHNTHLPTEHEPYFSGDGRALFHKGEHIDKTSAIHAEAKLIAQAARQGISLDGTELFVTTFPCPPCAKLIATAGIAKLYFKEGYALFDGETILKSAGVQRIRVA